MRIHKAGRRVVLIIFIILCILNGIIFIYDFSGPLKVTGGILSIIFILIVACFYRNPRRYFCDNLSDGILASADGKIVAIEEVYEPEYFKGKRVLVAIFMSPLNVHINWYPLAGKVLMVKHHSGRYQAAFLPKSSTENERSSIVMETECGKHQVLIRQIAGAMARRIVTYAQKEEKGYINKHLGFIKLGSRVDIYLPVGSRILVEHNQKVKGNQTVIARLPATN